MFHRSPRSLVVCGLWNPLPQLLKPARLACLAGALHLSLSFLFLPPSDPSRWESHSPLQRISPWPHYPGSDSVWLVVSPLEPEPELERPPLQQSSNNPLCRVQLDQKGTQDRGWDGGARTVTLSRYIAACDGQRQPLVTVVQTHPSLVAPFCTQNALTHCRSSCATILTHLHVPKSPSILLQSNERFKNEFWDSANSRTTAVHASAPASYYSGGTQLAISSSKCPFKRLLTDWRKKRAEHVGISTSSAWYVAYIFHWLRDLSEHLDRTQSEHAVARESLLARGITCGEL